MNIMLFIMPLVKCEEVLTKCHVTLMITFQAWEKKIKPVFSGHVAKDEIVESLLREQIKQTLRSFPSIFFVSLEDNNKGACIPWQPS